MQKEKNITSQQAQIRELRKVENENAFSVPIGKILLKNLLLIILITVLVTALGTVYAMLKVKPSYTRTGNAILRVSLEPEDKITDDENIYTDVSLAQYYSNTISQVIKSAPVMELANKYYKDDASMKQQGGISRGSVGVGSSKDSLILKISYTDNDPNVAKDKLSKVFTAAREILNNMEAINASEIDFLETSNGYYAMSVSDSKTSVIILAFGVGLVIALVAACIRYLLDNKVKDSAELEKITGSMVIAVIEDQQVSDENAQK